MGYTDDIFLLANTPESLHQVAKDLVLSIALFQSDPITLYVLDADARQRACKAGIRQLAHTAALLKLCQTRHKP